MVRIMKNSVILMENRLSNDIIYVLGGCFFMIKVTLSNEILKYITEIDKNRYKVSEVSLPVDVASKLR